MCVSVYFLLFLFFIVFQIPVWVVEPAFSGEAFCFPLDWLAARVIGSHARMALGDGVTVWSLRASTEVVFLRCVVPSGVLG